MLKSILLSLLAFLSVLPAHAEEPLLPEQAFRFSARMLDAQHIEARWEIAPGYYMYRDKFKFVLEGASLGAIELPTGLVKEDENFGKVETYRDAVAVRLPFTAVTGALVLHATSQGCADIGICYPPQKQSQSLPLVAADTATDTPEWRQRLLQPGILWPCVISLAGILLVFVPGRNRTQALWCKAAGVTLMFAGAILLLWLNRETPVQTALAFFNTVLL